MSDTTNAVKVGVLTTNAVKVGTFVTFPEPVSVTRRVCPVCKSKDSYEFASKPKTFGTSGMIPEYEIRVCASCGVLYNALMEVKTE